MAIAKHCLPIVIFLLIASGEALSFNYTWDDYRKPFTQLILVPSYTSGTSTVSLDLPEDSIRSHESLTLYLDIESNIIMKIDGLEQKTFESWSAYCSVNGALFFGKHRLRVNHLPGRQTCCITLRTRNLKTGRNTLKFSMSPTDPTVSWRHTGNQMIVAYYIHEMWLDEFSASSQKIRGVPVDKTRAEVGAKKPREEKVAAISADKRPEDVERIDLRDRAEKNFSDQDLYEMITERNFFNKQINPGGNFPNVFIDNGDGTITDKVTGLMWQKGGSSSEMSFFTAGKYVEELNSRRFGGYGNWRLPTMEELCSLLEETANPSGKFVDTLFDPAQDICWSADESRRYSRTRLPMPINAAFGVNFSRGETSVGMTERFMSLDESRYYVRAVRKAE